MTELHERVAALEANQLTDRELIEKILLHVKSIDEQQAKIKGIFGAIWFILSCIGTFLGAWKFLHR